MSDQGFIVEVQGDPEDAWTKDRPLWVPADSFRAACDAARDALAAPGPEDIATVRICTAAGAVVLQVTGQAADILAGGDLDA